MPVAPAKSSDKPSRLNAPELVPDFKALADYGEGTPKTIGPTTDWRKLEPSEVVRRLQLPPGPERALLSTAVYVGTAQASLQGNYWAPTFNAPDAKEVDIGHLTRPISSLHPVDALPAPEQLKPKGSGEPTITCSAKCHPLDAAVRLASDAGGGYQVAVVRCTGMRDARNETAHHKHIKEDTIFLRTTYAKAFEKMKGDIGAQIGDSIDEGCVIATSGVGILRGPIEEGAVWLQEPTKVEVIWMGIEPRVQWGAEEDYAKPEDRNYTMRALDRAFGWAVAHGCDAVVLPPIGCGIHGCKHPRLDVADAIYTTAHRYGKYIPHVCIASDNPVHFQDPTWWDIFAEACQTGRLPLQALPGVPPIALPPYRLVPKDAQALVEKQKMLSARRPASRGANPSMRVYAKCIQDA